MKKNKIRIGFDLDGVIIGKPPFVPRKLLEWLYKSHEGKKLGFRYPRYKIEVWLRVISHYYFFRPAIRKNLRIVKKLTNSNDIEVVFISSRFSFLFNKTELWFDKNGLSQYKKKLIINDKDEQPHIFKERMIISQKLDYYIEDDRNIVDYLNSRLKRTKIIYLKSSKADLAKLLSLSGVVVPLDILIGISYYHPNISGLTIYAKNLSELLTKRGYNVRVVSAKQNKNLEKVEKINGIEVTRLWTPMIVGRGPIMPLFPIEVFKHIRRADIINYHIPSFEASIAVLLAKLLRKKVVLTHHCDLSNWEGWLNKITIKMTYLSLLISGYLADKIIVYTKDYADHSTYLSRFKDKLIYCLPPVSVEVPSEKLLIRNKYKNIKHKIGFAGRIGREKGIDVLLNAIPFLEGNIGKSFKILLAGPSSEVVGGGDKEKFTDLVNKYKERIEFLGSLDRKQMADFYSSVDVVVLPSVENLESFGFVQVEAMKLGCPVVASNLPGVRMPIQLSGMGLTANVNDSKDLAFKISKVLLNKKKYKKNRSDIDKLFNLNKSIKLYEQLFSDLS